MKDWLISKDYAEEILEQSDKPFAELMRHGTMTVELYRPEKLDLQQPHKQDELYFVISGHGIFHKNGEAMPFKAGDVIFVEAGLEHRFENFTDDFATYVVFWGKEGGE